MQTSTPLPPNNVFTSWKEIASYLNKGVRTVQRWEAEFGLPVKRPRERSRGIVHASREELDRWLNSSWARRAIRATDKNREVNEKHHQLRAKNLQLLNELHGSLQRLASECKSLKQQVETSRRLREVADPPSSSKKQRSARASSHN